MDCTVENKKQVKLESVVNAALVDMYADTGVSFQRANFMAARGLKKLYIEALPQISHKVWLPVNSNTHTATLPLDFDQETFVGGIDNYGKKFYLKLNNRITDSKNISTIPCEDKCDKCGQDKNICNDLVVTEETVTIPINDVGYTQTIIKKLYPNGDYYLETNTPVLNIDTLVIDYVKSKEFITNLDLKPCGCLETTDTNISKLQCYCPSTYCSYYATCNPSCSLEYGSYRIFEDTGLIQLDMRYPYPYVYMEYNGFISKIRGQYYVPMIAADTLTEYTKWKLIQNKSNVPRWERNDQFDSYVRERKNMMKVMGRISLNQIVQAVNTLPKFGFDIDDNWYSCFTMPTAAAATIPSSSISSIADVTGTGNNGGGGTTIINNNTYVRGGFVIAVKVDGQTGHPVSGDSTYQNNLLKNAIDVNYCFLAKQTLTILDGDFTFDTVAGSIDISPNTFTDGDSLIIPYNKATF